MSYVSTGYFGTGPQVQAINQALKASAAASPEQLYPPLAPVKFKETPMYVGTGAFGKSFALTQQIGTPSVVPLDSVRLPAIGVVKKTHLYIGAAVAALVALKVFKKI